MRTIKFILILLISFQNFGQTKPMNFYNENGQEITKEEFIELKDYSKNLDLYFENDSLQYGLLVKRQKFGKLNKKTLILLKQYLTEISKVKIDSTQNIVINYLTEIPKKIENTKPISTWNILDRNYLKKLHKIADINQFWINSPNSDNLKYYHRKRINWITDKDNLFKKIFFPYDVKYGNYILLKPDGKFYYYLGEHSKYNVWEKSRKFFK